VSYASDLAKLKRAVVAHERGQRKSPPRFFSCCVCPSNVPRAPTVETRFGPRCERHMPADSDGGNT